MISFSDWTKKDKDTDYEIVKGRSGLPIFVLNPPESVELITPDDEPVKKKKTIPQQVSDYITKHF